MKAEAKNEYSVSTANIAVKTPVITNVYITSGKITESESKGDDKATKKKITLDKKFDKGLFSRKYFLVVETKDFPEDTKAKFKISFKSKTKVLSDKDTAIKVLSNDADADSIEVAYNNYFNDDSITNKADFKNKAVAEFVFDRKETTDKDNYKKLISEAANKSAPLYLKVDEVLNEESAIEYSGDNSEDKKCFYFEKNYNLVEECYCTRKLTETDLENIITALNDGKKKSLFNHKDCKIKTEERTYKKLTEELNSAFEKYEINTCNRKAHFIAQMYLESARLITTEEFANGDNYELKNWEDRKTDLEAEIKDIDTLKPKIDAIISKNNKTAIDASKSQLSELEAKITEDVKLTTEEKSDIDKYKKIFEKEWRPNFDAKKTVKYKTRQEYYEAANGKFSGKTLKATGAVQKIKNIKDNGNTGLGDGPRYKGKGLIQLTWRSAYVSYFTYLKTTDSAPDSIKNKTVEQILDRSKDDMSQLLATDLYYAADSAGWFWLKYKKIGAAADYDGDTQAKWASKMMPTTEKITRMVNGGTNHLEDRKKFYNKIKNDIFKIKAVCVNHDKIK